jgi:hypothetical protein
LCGEEGSADEVAASKFHEEFKGIVEEGRYTLKQINFAEKRVFRKLCAIYVISPSDFFFGTQLSHKSRSTCTLFSTDRLILRRCETSASAI